MRTTSLFRRSIAVTIAALASASALTLTTSTPASAENFLVLNTANAGLNSLRWAVDQANANLGLDTIAFANGLEGTITLGQPIIVDEAVEIVGPGADILTVSGGGTSQLFRATALLSVKGLTLTDGMTAANGGAISSDSPVIVVDSVLSGNTASTAGGAVHTTSSFTSQMSRFETNSALFGGAVKALDESAINDSTFVNNTASFGGAVSLGAADDVSILRSDFSGNQAAGEGGAAYFLGEVNISSSTFIDNMSGMDGGAIYQAATADETLNIASSTLLANRSSTGSGGAIASTARVRVARSAIRDNTALSINGTGGGIFVEGDLTVSESEISGNQSTSQGGGVYTDGRLFFNNSTASGNGASLGGGISVTGTAASLIQSTIVDNTGIDSGAGVNVDAPTSLYATVVARNTTPGSPDILGEVTANFSFIGDIGTAVITGDNNLFGDPVLGPLADNGGPTLTHLPTAGSPLIDVVGPNLTVLGPADQRRFQRVVNGKLDIGAVEVNPEDQRIWDPVTPARLLDTRTNGETIDGDFEAGGKRGGGTTLKLAVAGRGGIPADARGAILNVTAVQPDGTGFVTAFSCNVNMPTASSLNYVGGVNLGNEVIVSLDDNGEICLFTSTGTHLTVDAAGVVGPASALIALTPARLLDTRADGMTIDGAEQAGGQRAADSEIRLPVAGRGGVPDGATAIIVNVTAVSPTGTGFVTVHGCEATRPLSSSLNFVEDVSRGNEIVSDLDAGDLCLYTSTTTQLVVDVVAALDDRADYVAVPPVRLLDTRANGTTIDGKDQGGGRLPAGTTTMLDVGGRSALPFDVRTVNLNVTAVSPSMNGFVTVWACDDDRPNTASLNFVPMVNGGNDIIIGVDRFDDDGPDSHPNARICLFNSTAVDLTVDISGYTIIHDTAVISLN